MRYLGMLSTREARWRYWMSHALYEGGDCVYVGVDHAMPQEIPPTVGPRR